jgi:isochorismate hydrolase
MGIIYATIGVLVTSVYQVVSNIKKYFVTFVLDDFDQSE